jgi:ribosome-binding protein aMBF1 (putative translation factor)
MQDVEDKEALANIARNVSKLRGTRSRSWLAREAKTYAINITRIESQEHMPGAGLLSRLAKALGTTADGLLLNPHQKKIQRGA